MRNEWMIQQRLSRVVICGILVSFVVVLFHVNLSIPSTNFCHSQERAVSYIFSVFLLAPSRWWGPRKIPIKCFADWLIDYKRNINLNLWSSVMITEPINSICEMFLGCIWVNFEGQTNCLLGSKEFIRLDRNKDHIRVYWILETVAMDLEESLENNCE